MTPKKSDIINGCSLTEETFLGVTFAIIWHTLYWIVHAPGKVGRQTFMNSDKDLATAGSTTN